MHAFRNLFKLGSLRKNLHRFVHTQCSHASEAPFHEMLDLEAQKLVVDGKLRCWLDIDVNDSRASYQRAVDFVGAKNLTCAFAEIHGLG